MKNYTIKLNDKKRRITISFSTKGKNNNFKCQLAITSLDNASLFVSSNKRQGINYMGVVSTLTEEK